MEAKKGLSELKTAFEVSVSSNADLVAQASDQAIAKALEAIGLQAEGYAKLLAPVDTGRLRNSISHEVVQDTVYIGTNVEYAAYQEFGTSRMKAQPYLAPAVENHLSEYSALTEAMLKQG